MNKPTLLLITYGFPYGSSEQSFLKIEFAKLQDRFRVIIFALHATDETICSELDKDTIVLSDKRRIGFKYLVPVLLDIRTHRELKKACWEKSTFKIFMKRLIRVLFDGCQIKRYERIIKKILEENYVHLVYTYWCTSATVAAVRQKKKHKSLKVITRLHGCDIYNERIWGGWQTYREEMTDDIDKIVLVSEQAKKYYIEHWVKGKGRNIEKCVVRHLGCKDWGSFNVKPSSSLSLISCSNVIPLKRVDLIIKALATIPSKYTVKWTHIGVGEQLDYCEKLAKNLLTSLNNIQWEFVGRVPNDKLKEIYEKKGAELFIMTSSTEGSPVSVQEALSMGLPVVATPVGILPELNESVVFLLSLNPDPFEIGKKIIDYIDMSEEEKNKLKINARKIWKNIFDADNNADFFVNEIWGMVEEM